MTMTLGDYTGEIGSLIGDLGRSTGRALATFTAPDLYDAVRAIVSSRSVTEARG